MFIGVLLIAQIVTLHYVFTHGQESPISAVGAESSVIEKVANEVTSSVVFIRTDKGAGSGVIVNSDGTIVTNYHVVEGTKEIKVQLSNDEFYTAELVGTDEETDLAVLKIDAAHLRPVEFADSDNVQVGELAVAIGNPFGYDFTVTSGIISAKHRDEGPSDYRDYLQTDASINPGNSGGALLDKDGKLIGINTFIVARERTGELGFAIPSNMVKEVVDQIVAHGRVERGYLGVSIKDIQQVDKEGNGHIVEGSEIEGLEANGPAQKAGLKVGDLFVEINGIKITDSNQLRNYVAFIPPGEIVNVTVQRNGTALTVPVELKARPKQK